MDTTEHAEIDRWVDGKLAALERGPWEPDANAGVALFRARQSAQRARTQRWAAAGVAMAAVTLSVPTTRALAGRCVDACVARVNGLFQPEPTDVARASMGWVPIAARESAPPLSVLDSEGTRIDLAGMRGQVVLLNFWATWCKPCTTEMPWFSEFQTRFHERGLSVLGLSIDDDGWAAVREYVRTTPVTYRLALATDPIAEAYGGITALPATFIVDRQGRIASRYVGIMPKATYEQDIERVLVEK